MASSDIAGLICIYFVAVQQGGKGVLFGVHKNEGARGQRGEVRSEGRGQVRGPRSDRGQTRVNAAAKCPRSEQEIVELKLASQPSPISSQISNLAP